MENQSSNIKINSSSNQNAFIEPKHSTVVTGPKLHEDFVNSFKDLCSLMLKNHEPNYHHNTSAGRGSGGNGVGVSDELLLDTQLVLDQFIEAARENDKYFIKKSLQIRKLKPELTIKDETAQLQKELIQKEENLQKVLGKIPYYENELCKLREWT